MPGQVEIEELGIQTFSGENGTGSKVILGSRNFSNSAVTEILVSEIRHKTPDATRTFAVLHPDRKTWSMITPDDIDQARKDPQNRSVFIEDATRTLLAGRWIAIMDKLPDLPTS